VQPTVASGDDGSRVAKQERERWWNPPGALPCAIAAALLIALVGWPVLRAPTEWLFGDEIVGRYHDPYTVVRSFDAPKAPSHFTQPATDYAGALAARFVGGVAAYNLVVLATFPLAACFTYLLAFRVSRSRAGAWLAAMLYAFSPFHLAHAAYHPHIAQVQWLPLYLLALWLALERATFGRLALVAGSLALVALSSFYFGLIAIVATPLALVGGWQAARGAGVAANATTNAARVGLAMATLAVGGWLYVRAVAPAVLDRPEALAFPSGDVARYTASPYAYFVPSVEHPAFGVRARAFWDRRLPPGDLLEQQLTVGCGLVLLAACALVAAWRSRSRSKPADAEPPACLRFAPALAALGALALVCSAKPTWQLFGVSFRGPSGWLYELAPMFRAHARFGLLVLLTTALLAAIGLAELLARRRRVSTLLAVALAALAIVELAPFPPFRGRDVLPTPAHRWLRRQPEPVRVLDCVSNRLPSELGVPALFGGGLQQLPASGDCGEPGFAAKLAARGFTHLLVRDDSPAGAALRRDPGAAGFGPVRAFEGAAVLAVASPPAPVYLELGPGFHLRQLHDDRSYRWMSQRGTIRLVNTTAATRLIALELVLHAMPTPRRVRFSFAAGADGEIGPVGLEPTPYLLPPFEVPPGGGTLELWSVEPATVADDVLHNGDPRSVSIALWEWEIRP
jgi:hypothetical protein